MDFVVTEKGEAMGRADGKEQTMSDLIRREDAIGACAYETIECYEARKAIRALPSADRPQGEWIDKGADLDGTWYYQCSNCHANVIEEQYPNCPYCLARMKGADDDNT